MGPIPKLGKKSFRNRIPHTMGITKIAIKIHLDANPVAVLYLFSDFKS